MIKIGIYGAGGLGKEVLTIIRSINTISQKYEFIGFFDDASKAGDVVGKGRDIDTIREGMSIVVAIGDPGLKSRLISKIHNPNISFPVLIHPSVVIGDESRVTLGDGAIIGAGSILTLDIEVGRHTLINLNCTIGHDSRIGDYSSLMPGVNIAGNVNVGTGSFLGSGVNVINNISLGERTIIGAGAVVISDIEPGSTAVGVPAEVIKLRK